ncbi:hypothetical protein WH87_17775 [Devosia epidermidihirudinis]|uniref:Mandelate racemase/muconate lactonizing enzyme C-terminal domain-containing protein n=1 Tax=Devosia epidermidihirudinis TaxID=1293439 RepID=A0A0F5Q2A6_9HYPH|nr:enolase C-terminal domain-like protein [Devosia epidermidihirudinis]KKC35020.1 hypothetical protein WH87_17775 [Devosia epidermidihirudinis]
MRIERFACWLLEAPAGPKFAWRKGLAGSHGGLAKGRGQVQAVIGLETDTGLRATIEVGNGAAAFDIVSRRYHHFIGEDPLLTERMWHLIWEVDRIEEFQISLLGLLDQLCWGIKSQAANLPIYQLLGGNERRIPAYASTVTWSTLDEYERHIKLCRDLGFRAFKLHAWGDVKRDIELSTKLREWVGPDVSLMFDGSAGWDYVDALEFGRAIQDLGYLWYEEPMREFHLGSYARLCEKLSIPVLAAETSDGVHWNAASWIEAGALTMARISAHYKGGFTGSMKIAQLCDSFGIRAQVHGMGHANAQLCAAIRNNDFYEQIVINEEQIRGLDKLGPLSIQDGYLEVSDKPGLGFEHDWDDLDRVALKRVEIGERQD